MVATTAVLKTNIKRFFQKPLRTDINEFLYVTILYLHALVNNGRKERTPHCYAVENGGGK